MVSVSNGLQPHLQNQGKKPSRDLRDTSSGRDSVRPRLALRHRFQERDTVSADRLILDYLLNSCTSLDQTPGHGKVATDGSVGKMSYSQAQSGFLKVHHVAHPSRVSKNTYLVWYFPTVNQTKQTNKQSPTCWASAHLWRKGDHPGSVQPGRLLGLETGGGRSKFPANCSVEAIGRRHEGLAICLRTRD
jgi:hypothetical protein